VVCCPPALRITAVLRPLLLCRPFRTLAPPA
jgi:hypothetical protein